MLGSLFGAESSSGSEASGGEGAERISFDEFLRWHEFAWDHRVEVSPAITQSSARRTSK